MELSVLSSERFFYLDSLLNNANLNCMEKANELIKKFLIETSDLNTEIPKYMFNIYSHLGSDPQHVINVMDLFLAKSNIWYISSRYQRMSVLLSATKFKVDDENSFEYKILEKIRSNEMQRPYIIYFYLKYVFHYIEHNEKHYPVVKSDVISYLESIEIIFPECVSCFKEWQQNIQ